ncbi:MAG: HlyC/CorC family transporter [Deltaproteobacteria bacterium]|nr:HlyC/CorC family transporter [Candidatus Zymogenaceae bacterium]
MESFLLQVILIFFLILANGFFAGSELAIISTRKRRVKALAEGEDKPSAKALLELKNDPDRFLSTIQVGITVIGSLASAVGGAAAVKIIEPVISKLSIPYLADMAQPIAIILVVAIISYFTLILGELVPKSVAIRFSEKIALAVAGPIRFISRVTSPVVKILTASNHFVLKLLKISTGTDSSFLTEEEILSILKEGEEKGLIDETEHELIHSIFEFADRQASDVMVPHPKIKAVDISWSKDRILTFIVETGLTRYPVYEVDLDNVLGFIKNKDVLEMLVTTESFDIEKIIHKPYFVPESKLISDLLREMQNERVQLAMVVDEYGDIAGLVTMEDLLEEIVGEIEDEHDDLANRLVKKYKDGTMIIDGSTSIRDLINLHGMKLSESDDFETIAGLILSRLQSIPKGGEVIRHDGYKFTVVNVEKNRIDKVRAEKEKKSERILTHVTQTSIPDDSA